MFISSLEVLEGCNKVSSFLQAKQAQLPQPYFIAEELQSFDQDNGITSNDWHWLLDIQIPFPGDVCVCVTLELQIWYAICGFLYQ